RDWWSKFLIAVPSLDRLEAAGKLLDLGTRHTSANRLAPASIRLINFQCFDAVVRVIAVPSSLSAKCAGKVGFVVIESARSIDRSDYLLMHVNRNNMIDVSHFDLSTCLCMDALS